MRYAGSGTSATNSWCERGIDYDLNGNIVTLQRFGSSAGTAEDNLIYGYTGNRLTALTGSSRGAELNASYSYDAGGNMLYDGRRGLGISYNILNLPAKVVEKTGATAADGAVKAEYLYSADGIKQRVVDGAGSNGYLYLGTLVLSKSGESYSLASTGFGGGRIIGTANSSCLAYYYGTDHLGSVRVITDGSGSVVERNDYYPLGMRTSTGNSYPQLTANLYKYNGKEVQTLGGLGFTDYGARMYDDFTGRWFVPDPLAEKYASMSPYMYCGGNPIMFFDKDGKIWDTFIDVGFLIYDVGAAVYYHATGEHETAKGYWVDAGIDAVAAVIPIASAGMTKLPKLIGKGSNAVEKSVDISKTAKVIDKTSDVKKGLKNADAIKEGKLFEQDELAKSIAEGKDVRGQITLVPLNGGGNVKGNRSRLDQLIRNDDNTYSIIETKLRPSTKLSPGQRKALEHVEYGNGMFEVRTKDWKEKYGLTIKVKEYKIKTKYPD